MRALLASIAVLAACAGAPALADGERARQNYLLHCMGCHGEDGAGLEGKVPPMRGMLASILGSPQGREYVLRVPGVTQSTLTPREIAEVLNWALAEFSGAEAARRVKPFTADEVARFKGQPLLEVVATRRRLLRPGE